MALRLQDSEEDKTHFVRGLPGPYRAFYFWLKRACDHAGVWEIDIDEARMRTGFFDLDADTAAGLLSKKVIKLPCGEKFFLIDFAAEQLKTTELNYANTYHRGVINIFNKLDIFTLISTYKLKPLSSGLKATKDMEIDKDKFIDKSIELEVSKVKAKKMPKSKKTSNLDKIDFDEFWDAYDKKKGEKDKITKKWDALSLKDQEAILIHIEAYKIEQPNKWYRKDPETYLNNKSWNDEVLSPPVTQAVATKKTTGKVVDMSTVAQYKPIEA